MAEFVRAVIPESGAQVSVTRKFAELKGLEILDKPALKAGSAAHAKPRVKLPEATPKKFKGSDESASAESGETE